MLNDEQTYICNKLIEWFRYNRRSQSYITVGGYAGTGKTYLLANLASNIKKQLNYKPIIAYCSYTGKSVSVLKSKLEEFRITDKSDYIGTIHRLIYMPEFKKDKKTGKVSILKWKKINYLNADLIIIDEASMITENLWNDLKGYRIPIIIFGDHGQLPPIGKNINLMKSPQYILKEIHRQALESPIIQLSIEVRNSGKINYGMYDKNVFKLNWKQENTRQIFNNINWDQDIICLCGTNKTRVSLNKYIRKRKNLELPDPYPGERIICLKNNYDTKIMNGQIGKIKWVSVYSEELYCIDLKLDVSDSVYSNLVPMECFNKEKYEFLSESKIHDLLKKSGYKTMDYFDFGYCISVHKSQGSEFKKLVVFEEKSKYWDDEYYSRWLYTAITRAKEKLFIIGGLYN